jgi:hypothetical protein
LKLFDQISHIGLKLVVMKLLILILGVSTLLSCSKERNFHLRAKNAVTGVPYAGLNYYVVEEREGNNGTDYTTVATGTLDGNGEKLVPVKIRKNRSYVIRLDPPPNWCYMNEVSYSYTIQGDKNPTFDFTFAECAYLKLNINNVNCQGSTDYFKLYHYGSDVGFLNVSQGSPIREGGLLFIRRERFFRCSNWRPLLQVGSY